MSAIFQNGYLSASFKFSVTNFKFELALSAIFQYGYQRGNFKLNISS